MKVRRKGTEEWQEIAYVQFVDNDILYKAENIEFEHDTLSTEIKTYDQVNEDAHWQQVREQAAIAAMQGILGNPALIDNGWDKINVEKAATTYAHNLVEILKTKIKLK